MRAENVFCVRQLFRFHDEIDVRNRTATGLWEILKSGVHALRYNCDDAVIREQASRCDRFFTEQFHPLAIVRQVNRKHV